MDIRCVGEPAAERNLRTCMEPGQCQSKVDAFPSFSVGD
jgi:hypothetical protein